ESRNHSYVEGGFRDFLRNALKYYKAPNYLGIKDHIFFAPVLSKLAKIDEEFERRRREEAEYQARMAERRELLEKQIAHLEKEIALIDRRYEMLEKQRSTILEAIEQMPREKKIELFRETFGQ
ncbi:MAG: hypothetical protein ONB13_13255, partial [candidate division KSB1 bacterium]|nr:hypothetical protein [candidate division KSB1 bacterium]